MSNYSENERIIHLLFLYNHIKYLWQKEGFDVRMYWCDKECCHI